MVRQTMLATNRDPDLDQNPCVTKAARLIYDAASIESFEEAGVQCSRTTDEKTREEKVVQ